MIITNNLGNLKEFQSNISIDVYTRRSNFKNVQLPIVTTDMVRYFFLRYIVYILEVISFRDGLIEFNGELMERQPKDIEKFISK